VTHQYIYIYIYHVLKTIASPLTSKRHTSFR